MDEEQGEQGDKIISFMPFYNQKTTRGQYQKNTITFQEK